MPEIIKRFPFAFFFRFTCETCGKLLTTKSKLEAHVKAVHEGLKPFSCTYCNKRFGTNGNLKNHEVAMHTGEFPHRCSLCDKGFTRKQALFSHIQQNHRIESRPKTVHTKYHYEYARICAIYNFGA